MQVFDHVLTGATGADSLTLSFDRRVRSRQRVRLDSGLPALLALPRGTVLRGGDVLGGPGGATVVVRSASEAVSTATADTPLLVLRAAYHLGNRHVAVQLGDGWLRYLHDHVLDDMLRGLGLQVAVGKSPFEPEAGAYAAAGHGHTHAH
ncbi:urease accessory protein UreE [Immundisolibacter sp.]|uniref:urease accessory protein UreE n=1 Tax=Immundisolibacter sp. TaxID=1934948 RepID=UPI0035680FD0